MLKGCSGLAKNLFQIDLVWLVHNSSWSSVPCSALVWALRASGCVVIASCCNGAACSPPRMLGETRKPCLPDWLISVNCYSPYSSLIQSSICRSSSCPDGILPLAGSKSIFPQCDGVGREGYISCLAGAWRRRCWMQWFLRWFLTKRVSAACSTSCPPGLGCKLARKIKNFPLRILGLFLAI